MAAPTMATSAVPPVGWISALKNEASHERDVLMSYLWKDRDRGFATLNNDLVSRVVRSGRPWEGWLTKYLKAFAAPDKVSLDVGANIGAHTITLAECSHKVIALEPQGEAYRCLSQNTNHLPNISAVQAAASWESGSIGIRHSMRNRGASRLSASHANEYVDTVRLDDVACSDLIGFIKIDVEGHERKVLLGAERILSESRPVVVIEDTTKARDILKQYDYQVHRISLKDYLCVPSA